MNHWKTAARLCLYLSILVLLPAFSVGAQALSDDALSQIRFEQKLGAQVTLSLPFRDAAGRAVELSQYFGRKPVVLVLGYYECPMLCTLVLNGLVDSAADMKWTIGREFAVIDVSINPKETPALAAAKKRTYIKQYGRPQAGQDWHFLIGQQAAVRQLADEVGFRYAYDPASKQYAHPSGLVILTPEGKVSRYLFGVAYSPNDLYAALRQASSNNVGSPIQQLILLCFHYNPLTGKYSGTIMLVLRLFGLATMAGLLWLVAALARRKMATRAALISTVPQPRASARLPQGERP